MYVNAGDFLPRMDVKRSSCTLFNPPLPSLSRQSKLEGCIEELELMQGEIAKLEKRKKALNVAFEAMLGLENKFEDELTRVFKKKVKRVKKNEQTESKGEVKERIMYNVRCCLVCVSCPP